MKKFITFSVILIIYLFLFSSTRAEILFNNIPIYKTLDSLPYLGQTRPDTIPVIFGQGFISSNNADEYSICFSQDGKEIYFSRSTPNVSNTIWWTHFESGAWISPVNPPFTENYYNSEPFITYNNQILPYISPDGKCLFIAKQGNIWWVDSKVVTWNKPVGINKLEENVPEGFRLGQNYPNPFNPRTVIHCQLPVVSNVLLRVYDEQGREVQTLINERLNTGTYEVKFDGSKLKTGYIFIN